MARPLRSFKYLRGNIQVRGAGAQAERINSLQFKQKVFGDPIISISERWRKEMIKNRVVLIDKSVTIGCMIKEEYIKNRLQYTKDLLKYYVSTVLDEDLSYTQTEFVVDQIGTLKMQIAEFENELAEQA